MFTSDVVCSLTDELAFVPVRKPNNVDALDEDRILPTSVLEATTCVVNDDAHAQVAFHRLARK